MKKFMIIYIFFLLGSFVSTKCLAQDVAWIEGCVYEDGNQNGIQDKGEKGISGIAISNGDTVLLADKQGHFRIRLSKGNSIFPILPNNIVYFKCKRTCFLSLDKVGERLIINCYVSSTRNTQTFDPIIVFNPTITNKTKIFKGRGNILA